MTDDPTIDPDAPDDGGRPRRARCASAPVTVLGLGPERHRPGPLPRRRRRPGDGLRRPAGRRPGRGDRRARGPRRARWRSGRTWIRRATWAGAALVTTSPSINPDYPTTEPRLRAALAALVAARAGGDPSAPALVSEPDLFLRLCEAPTIGVTGTKGKTTTASLTAAILAGRPGPPGRPRRQHRDPDRRAARRADARPPGRLRAVRAAAADPVARARRWRSTRTSPSDHLDRHGSLEAYRRGQAAARRARRPRRARSSSTPRTRSSAAYAGLGTAPAVLISARSADARRARRRRRLDRGRRRRALAAGRRRDRRDRPGRPDHADRRAGHPRRPQRRRTPWPRSRSGCCSASRPTRSAGRGRRSPASSIGSRPVAVIDGVRFVNDSQGTQPDAVIAALRAFEAPVVLIAGGRDKGVDLSALPPVVAERAVGRRRHRRERAGPRSAGSGPPAWRRVEARRLDGRRRRLAPTRSPARRSRERGAGAGPATVLLSPAAASFDMFVDYAARGRAFKDAVAALAAGPSARTAGRDR